ncbi:ribonuclease III [Xylaria cf. heliscus]|nr:ribonuclease III [Xylaria cf. heliscus]
MKRIRIDQLSRQWLATTPRPTTTASRASRSSRVSRLSLSPSLSPSLSRPAPAALHAHAHAHTHIRCQSTSITPEAIFDHTESPEPPQEKETETETETETTTPRRRRSLPSPHPDRAPRSAKLAALHARLSLSSRIPLQSLARTLVDPSADAHPRFNNANLAFVGASLLQYHTSEWLIAKYPRLPMAILFASMKGYAGDPALCNVARSWGVQAAGAPGEEVDPGYLQFAADNPTVALHKWGYVRAEAQYLDKFKWRRGMSSRIVFDDPFGSTITNYTQEVEVSNARNTKELVLDDMSKHAYANFVRAVIGAVYLHCGAETAKMFIRSYILSRQLDFESLFEFRLPQRELTRLCARENFDPPVARLLSETGRLSRTPVYVVGIYSGGDQLGEAAGASLQTAKIAASINALKSWYLYSPAQVGLPSDTFAEDAAPWKPVYVDIGEVIS